MLHQVIPKRNTGMCGGLHLAGTTWKYSSSGIVMRCPETLAKLVPRISGSVDRSGNQAECRVLLDDPLEMTAHTLTRKRSCAARVRVTCGFAAAHEWLLWVLKIPSLEKDASSVNNTEAAKGFKNSLLQVPL
ncbi:hypothetical protein TNCV_231571 [Trichonephila clavipes]|nr:hypothetical protein TNCV_231571 [Trichonephila clavipes]